MNSKEIRKAMCSPRPGFELHGSTNTFMFLINTVENCKWIFLYAFSNFPLAYSKDIVG